MTVFLPLPDILQGNFKPDYYLKHIQKDLRLAISMGDMANHPTPMAAAANEVQLCFSVSCSCCLSSNMWTSGQQKRFVQPLFSVLQVYKRAKALDQSDNDISAVYRAYIH